MLPDTGVMRAMIERATTAAAERALHHPHPGLEGLAALLSPAAEPLLGRLAARSAALTRQRFGRAIGLYAPLYLHNYCINSCGYCGFAAGNRIARRLLTLEEAEAEAEILLARGFQHLLLVAGEAPARMGADYLAELAGRLRDRFASLSIEVQPLSTSDYARLFAAGITSVAIYQETYDPEVYRRMHPAGPKSDYGQRLDTPARAAAAGMREVGIGALLGLADWRLEGLALGHHLAWLRKRFWRTGFTVSFPRIRPAAGEFAPLMPVTEANLSQLMFALRLFDPDVGLVLSTREEARFRDGMIGLAPTRYSAGSCTAPGGYGGEPGSGEQFAIGDLRSLDEVAAAIRRHGYDPVRKDWDACFQQVDRGLAA
ncbi:MAG: 2-iminoacetate synthase ThiH [Thermodesulfobacteriota bacterium]